MSRCEKLLARASRNPTGLKFDELCHLAECFGFEFSRQRGSHRIYRHAELRRTISLQDYQGEAKPYQVRQLLQFIMEQGGPDG
jgi:predicted RNA binding protein YcfA (HicA-like mRNA interferase family)